jgi:D-lactate dehydrogenase (cytochrome)
MAAPLPEALQRQFRDIVGPAGVLTAAEDLAPYLREWRGLRTGSAALVILPATTAEAAASVALCARHGIGIVPQGGNTGLVAGGVARHRDGAPEIILGARRLRRIRELDAAGYTLTAEAGCVLAELQAAATAADRTFPLSLAAEGSCQLGGNLSTNAGGTNVLRYGTARELVLGLEVVLPDGRMFEGLRGLRKDNTGYDLKQLFLGAEGTLGFITAATCKLFPRPRAVATAMVAVADPAAAVTLLAATRVAVGESLTAFELLSDFALRLVIEAVPGARAPLGAPAPWYVLVELAGQGEQAALDAALEEFLAGEMTAGRVSDGVTARSEAQRQSLWSLRHHVSDAQRVAGASIKNDVAVPVAAVPALIDEASRRVLAALPGTRVVAFGHVGDGNIHFNLSQPPGMAAASFLAEWSRLTAVVNEVVAGLGGTFSAEHGVGLLKTAELARYRGGVERELMLRIKRTLDPGNIMNPGKLFGD